MRHRRTVTVACLLAALVGAGLATPSAASSHREAPFVTEHPKVDGTDLYAFRSYEAGREGYVTLLSNYLPLQDAYGGPNYFDLDPQALYSIHVDNDGDSQPDLSFEMRVIPTLKSLAIGVGEATVPVALKNIGAIGTLFPPLDDPNLNISEEYEVRLVRGTSLKLLSDAATGAKRFAKPSDNIGTKSIPDYAGYAAQFVYDVKIPDCANGRMFVGQRKEGFQVNLGEVFDLVNVGDPVGDEDGERSATEFKNITTFALEVPRECLTEGQGDVIGIWMTASLPEKRILETVPTFEQPERVNQQRVQVSRLGMPLVNEVVIGLPDKDKFNSSRPVDDGQFALYVTNPTLPELLELLFGTEAPNNFPRNDLLATFVTGITGVNALGFGEMQRLNTAIEPVPAASQNRLGVIGGDLAGFPNGRRPGDDVVDIELRVAMGLLCHDPSLGLCAPEDAPSGLLPFTDGALVEPAQFDETFPYLRDPVPGSPNALNGIGEK